MCGHGLSCFFFFQAEDGIRDGRVTGVQTCALPIWEFPGPFAAGFPISMRPRKRSGKFPGSRGSPRSSRVRSWRPRTPVRRRSEERRVGKEWRLGGVEDGWEEQGGVASEAPLAARDV